MFLGGIWNQGDMRTTGDGISSSSHSTISLIMYWLVKLRLVPRVRNFTYVIMSYIYIYNRRLQRARALARNALQIKQSR